MVTVAGLTAADVLRSVDALKRVYGAAFAPPPYRYNEYDVFAFDGSMRRHTAQAGFKLCAARDEKGVIVGFAYGYTSLPGQWWYDLVSSSIPERDRKRWLGDCFELAELALLPAYQGQGIGGRLHDLLFEGLPHRTAALSTAQEETAGQRLYRNRGWQILVDGFRFPYRPHPYRILGLDLQTRVA
jgi:ribosomal protein S18 acetylase RimI-like enzyme